MDITILSIIGLALLLTGAVAFLTVYRLLRELHLTMNSRLDELLATTRDLARAEGFRAGQADHSRVHPNE